MKTSLWTRLFLQERPSIVLSLFRVFVALTVGFVMLPTFVHMADTYYPTAFKSLNGNFFPIGFLELVQKSPIWLINFFVGVFIISWLMFLLGLFSQMSCIVMTLSCYFFYALNSFAMGTLSWDVLLVTMFLMCITSYHGDYFSLDAIRKGDVFAFRKKRPFFLQRLLQIQLAATFFFTALHKITGSGNWLTDNPLYYVMNYPSEGVTKNFLLRDFLRDQPELCWVLGVTVVVLELLLPFLLFYKKTRVIGVYLGVLFQTTLLLTLDVPATFFFLFTPMFFLFIHPNSVMRWIDVKRIIYRSGQQSVLIYDAKCQLCQKSVAKLQMMDIFSRLKFQDLHTVDLEALHIDLNHDKAMQQMYLIEPDKTLYGGFFVVRRLSFMLPMLYICIPFVYFPGMGLLGPVLYKILAKNRYWFNRHKDCKDGYCATRLKGLK